MLVLNHIESLDLSLTIKNASQFLGKKCKISDTVCLSSLRSCRMAVAACAAQMHFFSAEIVAMPQKSRSAALDGFLAQTTATKFQFHRFDLLRGLFIKYRTGFYGFGGFFSSSNMIPDFPIDIRIRLAELKFFCCFLTLLIFCPVGLLSFISQISFNWLYFLPL